jgi:hypothetical protein
VDQNQDFNDIALSKFLATSPELGGLILSFKDITDDLQEESDMKVGVFILKSGAEVFYVPVVSKMDNVYPIDSIFFASRQKFFPITKKTIATIISSSQMDQGRGKKIPTSANLNPDVSQLINPPRTGKFVSASTSRLGDFMASMPDYLKDFTLEKISEEKTVYENLHKMFSIRDLFAALKSRATKSPASTVGNLAPVQIITIKDEGLTPVEIKAILENGYHVRGAPEHNRIAVTMEDQNDGKFTTVSDVDGDSDYEVVMQNASTKEAFVPKLMDIGQNLGSSAGSVAIFTSGDYAVSSKFVVKGDKLARKEVLNTVFEYNPPVLPRDVTIDDTFAIINGSAELLGVFTARKVMLNHLGVEIDVGVIAGPMAGAAKIHAYRNYGAAPQKEGRDIYIPYSSLVIKLGANLSSDIEITANAASIKHCISQKELLGDTLKLSFDGVEFSANGEVLGQEKAAMQRLVVEESIDPNLAKSFIKQAKERKVTTIYLSKQAGQRFEAGQIAEFGEKPQPQGKLGLNGSFIPSVQKSLALSDAQVTEATIISELLQAPNMFDLIQEYIPDIEECIDKLGRILFLSRVHINQLSENNDTDSVFGFLANLKSVYRMLGDNVVKLQELLALRPNEKN